MSAKRPHVPETHETKPNREQRRHPDRPPGQQAPPHRQEAFQQGPQEVTDPGAKNSGHKKKTADNWNQ